MTKRKVDVDDVFAGEQETQLLKVIQGALARIPPNEDVGGFTIEDVRLADDNSSVWCVLSSSEIPGMEDHLEIFVEFVRRLEETDEEFDEELDDDDEYDEWEDEHEEEKDEEIVPV